MNSQLKLPVTIKPRKPRKRRNKKPTDYAVATHVTINGKTYKLGTVIPHPIQIECLDQRGTVQRRCPWQIGGMPVGTQFFTKAETLHYHN